MLKNIHVVKFPASIRKVNTLSVKKLPHTNPATLQNRFVIGSRFATARLENLTLSEYGASAFRALRSLCTQGFCLPGV